MQSILRTLLSYSSPQVIALLTGAGIFFTVLFIAILRDEAQNRNARRPRPKDEWLFTRWDEKLFDAFIRTSPESVLKSLGVDAEQYLKDCAVAKVFRPNLKRLAARKLIGLFVVFMAVLLMILSDGSGMLITLAMLLSGYFLYEAGISRVTHEAKRRRQQIMNELPRFMDLLQTALYINIPVNEAITITSKYLKGTLISEELMASMAETQVGAVSWQTALQDVATKYEVDTFSDFVLYLITGYEKGMSIYDVVSRQAREVRQFALVSAEENAGKVNNSVLVPIAIYKLVPLLVLIGLPFLNQLTSSGLV